MHMKNRHLASSAVHGLSFLLTLFVLGTAACHRAHRGMAPATLREAFLHPPDSARPGVYWYFMDGQMSREGITRDLESMRAAGIGKVVFLEVNVGVPRGPVDFLGPQWLDLFAHAVREARRLGIQITLGIGPGWTGSGGPWVPLSESMQHLVASTLRIGEDRGGDTLFQLPLPPPKAPYFGEGSFSPALKEQWKDYYRDVAVLAFPTPPDGDRLAGVDEKALYYRAPFTSVPGVPPFLPDTAALDTAARGVTPSEVIDLTERMAADGTLAWDPPPGSWTILRFVSRNNGALTRPAPVPGLGFESDKFDTAALAHHLKAYIGKILQATGLPSKDDSGGLSMLHMDSWEMGAQNWSSGFREAFRARRGYDPLPYYPVYAGVMVGSRALSERFLWDLRLTAQELVLERHARYVKAYAHQLGLGLSIEPYDMNPTADLALGSVADIPMGEFWSKSYGFASAFSCIEATSIAHVQGIARVQAEAFTADGHEAWKQYPGSMKDQGDWAFAAGINQFFYHTFQHKPWADSVRPGMTMGPYGVHWDRKQTWWPLVAAYHRYVARCQLMLRQGSSVADILYLTPEGAPQVFQPPPSALSGDAFMPDRRGHNFDGVDPGQLYAASVRNHRIEFPGGASYRVLVLPRRMSMTPALLKKIGELVEDGAQVVGDPPRCSPSLSGYPGCDLEVARLAAKIWGDTAVPAEAGSHAYGRGRVFRGGALSARDGQSLYPAYGPVAALLEAGDCPEDFSTAAPLRYTHRTEGRREIYFVSNRTDSLFETPCTFRVSRWMPALWDPLTGKVRSLPVFARDSGRTTIPLRFEPFQSYFIVFEEDTLPAEGPTNFPYGIPVDTLQGPWQLTFDPRGGGPAKALFPVLSDWTTSQDPGIKYYAGVATYRKTFDLSSLDTGTARFWLNLGPVHDLARIRLNGKSLGVLWTAPWQVEVTGQLRPQGNHLEIDVANRWPNRLIGDARLRETAPAEKHVPAWVLGRGPRTGPGFTYTTYPYYHAQDTLLPSGLLGPVTLIRVSGTLP